jgi:hypothetical protein
MKLLSGLAVSAALALLAASAPSLAQDKPSTPAANKLGNSSKPATKAAKPTWQGPTSLQSTPAATQTQDGPSAKPSTPEASRTAPAGDGYKSCHGKESDA